MLTPVAHTIQLLEETQPDTAPAKPKDKTASQTAGSDFGRLMCQFLGAVQSAQQTDQEHTTDSDAPAGAAQPAPKASVTLPEKTALFLGVNTPDAPAGEGAETAALPIAAPSADNKAVLAGKNGIEDAVIPVANDKAAAPIAVGADQQPSHNAGYPPKQEKPDLHELLAKQEPSGVIVDESKTGEPAGAQCNALLPEGDFSAVMHQESSDVRNVQAQISEAAIPHRTHAGNESAPLRTAHVAEALDANPVIVKDGSRLAVKFEQEGLGKLDIDLRLNKGIINAQIQVADNSTKTLIENNTQQIMDSLLKAGLSIGGFSVSLRGGGGQQGAFEGQSGCDTKRTAVSKEAATGIAQRAVANGLVSIFI